MLKLHAGVSKKVGLPNYSSASASCTIEAELDSSLLQDHQGFQIVVQRAYQSCEQAVQDQITRLVADDARAVDRPVDARLPDCLAAARARSRGHHPSRTAQRLREGLLITEIGHYRLPRRQRLSVKGPHVPASTEQLPTRRRPQPTGSPRDKSNSCRLHIHWQKDRRN